jgi:hypothetical protein
MKVRAIWRKKNFNPFFLRQPPCDSFYQKVVDVPINCDMEELKNYAEADSQEGYVFARFEVMQGSEWVKWSAKRGDR